ncbi:MAG: Na+/H+ antiporter subunit G [Pseudonocardiaceae bacterium]|nr:Na+/H+ antiporter subunit G [Pseudonocardiaceae bacterium]
MNVVVSVCLLSGAALCVVGAFGMLRLPDTLSQLQAATKPQTLGLLLILLGVALRLDLADGIGIVLVMLFQVCTAPVLSQIVGRAAYRIGVLRQDTLVVDELRSRLAGDRDDHGAPPGGEVTER